MLLKRELVRVGLVAKTADEAIELAARGFVEAGYALPSFPQAVADRELVFATGIGQEDIPGAPFDVALPHADEAHVRESSVGVVTMAQPVDFRSMYDHDTVVHPRILFVLGIAESTRQLLVLQKLTRLLQEEGLLAACYACATEDELFELLVDRIGA